MKQTKIQLASPNDCTACAACVSVCPKQCISMQEDKEGFLQPKIDTKQCISCHKCEKVCPIINPLTIPQNFETIAYAVINRDEEVRAQSSSGGVFFPLAKWVIEQGGVVFGAKWNDKWEVEHAFAEDIEGVKQFMKSKYVQSVVGDTFVQAKKFLEQGRYVLYSGTPCQISGLKAFLRDEFDNLFTIDLICHGVPSPKVWRTYLNGVQKNNNGAKVVDVNFRDKKNGWIKYQQVIALENLVIREDTMDNVFFRGFLKDVYLRRSCYNCKFKTIMRLSDITLADAWGIQYYLPEMHDDKGTSLVVVHSQLGKYVLENNLNLILKIITLSAPLYYNPSLVESVNCPKRRKAFFVAFRIGADFLAKYYIDKDSIYTRVKRKLCKMLK